MGRKLTLAGFLLLYNFIAPNLLTAQPKCSIEHFSTANGLSDNRVTCIIKDHDGFMWMGTWTGINRFDGHNFVTYKSHPGDRSELKNNRIDFMVEDDSGFLWLKAYDQHIYRFDKKKEQFISISKFMQTGRKLKTLINKIIPLQNDHIAIITKSQGFFLVSKASSDTPGCKWFSTGTDAAYRVPSDSITSFYQDKAFNTWIGSKRGLTCLQAQSNGSYRKITFAKELALADIRCIFEGSTALWFGTGDGKLLGLNKSTGKLVALAVSKGQINDIKVSRNNRNLYLSSSYGELLTVSIDSFRLSSSAVFRDRELLSIYEDKNGLLWIEPNKTGIVMFNPATKSFRLFTQTNYSNHLHDVDEYGIAEDNKGNVWINMKGCGFGYFDSLSGTVKQFYNTPELPDKKFSNMVSAEFLDPSGILWLSTDDGGLEKIVFQPNDFRQTTLVNNTFLRVDNEVRGMYADSKDRLWIATKANKIYVSGDDKAINKLFPDHPRFTASIYVIIEDRNGNIWLGTKGDGLFKAEPVNDKRDQYRIRHFANDANDPYSISNNQVYSLLEDKMGRIWVGTYEGGVNLIDETGPTVKFYHHKNKFRQYPADACNKVRHLGMDADGRIWIGTTEGLLITDPNKADFFNQPFIRYSKTPGHKESLGDNDVQFIYRDRNNTMWLLTSSGGLNKAIGKDPMHSLQFQNYLKKDGLPSDYLLSCIEDRQGNLWIATQNGLSGFNISQGTFRNFDASDGLPALSFAEASCALTISGELVFGTIKGYLHFNPAEMSHSPISASLAFTNLQVNSDDVFPGEKASPLQYTINSSKEITLAYDQNILSIDYAILDYRSEEKESYAYRLLGFDSTWHNNKSARRATYTNLPPGEYVFEVKSTSADLYTDIPSKSLRITILPPPWKTWWAYTAYVLLAVLLFLIIRKNAITLLRLRQRIIIERKLADLRINFFTNISHELRTPLTLILNPLEEISKKESLSVQGNWHLNLVRKNALRMTRFVNQLLDLRKAQSGKAVLKVSYVDLVSFIRKVAGYFTDMADQKKITLSVEPVAEQVPCWIDAEKIDIVIYNILANAFKFSPIGKSIKITVGHSSLNGNIIIEIIDEGTGVPEQELDAIFGLYFESRQPAGSHLKGTGIGLALSRELVQLHQGFISARNNAPHGLAVKVELKPGKTHFDKDHVYFTDVTPDMGSVQVGELVNEEENEQSDETIKIPFGLAQLLLVEDNRDLRSFLKNQLGNHYRVEIAENGKEGLEKAIALLPDVILSDVMMPVMDGITMLDKLKNNPVTSHIPVVLLSAKFSVESQIQGLNYGADHYITKPFNNEFLVASIDNLLRQRKKLFESLLKNKKAIDIQSTPIVITSHDELFLQKVIEIVEERMGDTQFNIDVVAESVHMSRSAFYKKLKSLTSHSPVEFVREIRLKRSIQFLDAGELNISLIAYEVGFTSARYFSTCFKQRFGQTPSEYIRSNIKNTI